MASAKFKFYMDAILKELSFGKILQRDDAFDIVDVDGNVYAPKTPSSELDLNLPGTLWFKEVDSTGPGVPNMLELYYNELLVLVVDRDDGNIIYGIGDLSLVPVNKGGTNATTAEQAAINLGVGGVYNRNVGTAVGNLIEVLAGGKLPALDISDAVGAPAFPVGIPFYWLSNTVAPPSALECDGSLLLRDSYPALFDIIGEQYGAGDGSTSFRLPDFRGEFIRVWDHGKGIDPGREFASSQGDAIRNITGQAIGIGNGDGLGYSGAIFFGNYGGSGRTSSGASYRYLDFNASRVVPVASENRPRNVALPIYVRYE